MLYSGGFGGAGLGGYGYGSMLNTMMSDYNGLNPANLLATSGGVPLAGINPSIFAGANPFLLNTAGFEAPIGGIQSPVQQNNFLHAGSAYGRQFRRRPNYNGLKVENICIIIQINDECNF